MAVAFGEPRPLALRIFIKMPVDEPAEGIRLENLKFLHQA
jgi:hypothetical protein